ncbi:MAG: hypothetical protein IJO64_04650 [Clostridia bacterium]|nr:hypothetical protein [Clostridia bacterium]
MLIYYNKNLSAKRTRFSPNENGTDFEQLGKVYYSKEDEVYYRAEIDASGKSGRYVKISVTVNGTWCFMNEIEVYNA